MMSVDEMPIGVKRMNRNQRKRAGIISPGNKLNEAKTRKMPRLKGPRKIKIAVVRIKVYNKHNRTNLARAKTSQPKAALTSSKFETIVHTKRAANQVSQTDVSGPLRLTHKLEIGENQKIHHGVSLRIHRYL
jgi:hypothetical protein